MPSLKASIVPGRTARNKIENEHLAELAGGGEAASFSYWKECFQSDKTTVKIVFRRIHAGGRFKAYQHFQF
jgi:hypothetical protein